MVFIFESLLPLFFPNCWKSVIKKIDGNKPGQLRTYGLFMFVVGFLIVIIGVKLV